MPRTARGRRRGSRASAGLGCPAARRVRRRNPRTASRAPSAAPAAAHERCVDGSARESHSAAALPCRPARASRRRGGGPAAGDGHHRRGSRRDLGRGRGPWAVLDRYAGSKGPLYAGSARCALRPAAGTPVSRRRNPRSAPRASRGRRPWPPLMAPRRPSWGQHRWSAALLKGSNKSCQVQSDPARGTWAAVNPSGPYATHRGANLVGSADVGDRFGKAFPNAASITDSW